MSDLKSQIQELEKKTTELQVEIANQEFELQFEDSSHVSKILQHIDKDYEWQSKNAALAVYVYDKLKAEYKAGKATETSESENFTVYLKSTELTGLYNILLNISGTGVEKARSFARLLANVGQQVTTAMDQLAERNTEVRTLHEELRQLEEQLHQEQNEASEQIEEEVTNS
jgi:gas vesicle protein